MSDRIRVVIGDRKDIRFKAYAKDPVTGKPDLTTPVPINPGTRVMSTVKVDTDPDSPVIIQKDSDVGPDEIELFSSPNDNEALVKLTPADTVLFDTDPNPGEGDYVMDCKVEFTGASPAKEHTIAIITLCAVRGVTAEDL